MKIKNCLLGLGILFFAFFLLIPVNVSASGQKIVAEAATVKQQVTLIKDHSSNTKYSMKTGDNFDSILWIILLILSASVCILFLGRRKIIDK